MPAVGPGGQEPVRFGGWCRTPVRAPESESGTGSVRRSYSNITGSGLTTKNLSRANPVVNALGFALAADFRQDTPAETLSCPTQEFQSR